MFRFEVVDLMEWPKFSYQVKVEEENEELRDVYTHRPGEEKERKQKTTDRGNYSQIFRVFPDFARHYLKFFPLLSLAFSCFARSWNSKKSLQNPSRDNLLKLGHSHLKDIIFSTVHQCVFDLVTASMPPLVLEQPCGQQLLACPSWRARTVQNWRRRSENAWDQSDWILRRSTKWKNWIT